MAKTVTMIAKSQNGWHSKDTKAEEIVDRVAMLKTVKIVKQN